MRKIVAVDFDGTVVMHEYPDVGGDVPGAVEALKLLVKEGWSIILWTMRSGQELKEAVEWYKDRRIQLWQVNCNPEQASWTNSPKAYAQRYVDDAAVGCPLVRSGGGRPYVSWPDVLKLLLIES
jgi:hydroxymethylpyrimidine pyrophosphatase-like HAD family hydrolase